jgi:hypothetical protein
LGAGWDRPLYGSAKKGDDMQSTVLYGYLAFPRLDGSADLDIESMASVMAVSISTIMDWLTNLIEYGFIEPHSSMHPGTFVPLPHPSFLMPTEVAHARAALIGHVATFDTVASLDAWIEAKTEEDRLLDTPLPLGEAIREAGYILAARAALHVKDINRTTKS